MQSRKLSIKVYYERPLNSNPYYALSEQLCNMSKFIKELIGNELLKDKLHIKRFKGGNRNPILNECELDMIIDVSSDNHEKDITNIIDELARKFSAKYLVERGERYDS